MVTKKLAMAVSVPEIECHPSFSLLKDYTEWLSNEHTLCQSALSE